MEGLAQPPSAPEDGGRLFQNIMYFARTLRAAGMPIGPGKVLDALEAVRAVGLENRRDFYWTLHAVFVNKHDQEEIFDQAFHIFWRNPQLLEKMLALMLPGFAPQEPEKGEEMNRRLAEALHGDGQGKEEEGETEIELDAAMTFSAQEMLREMDFEKMSNEEVAQAKKALARLALPLADLPTRRFAPDPRGTRVDLRATMRAQLRAGGIVALKHKQRRTRPPPLVVLCDISGSMEPYARALLMLLYCISADQGRGGPVRDGTARRPEIFSFATRLTRLTSALTAATPDAMLAKAGEAAPDWSGGTRIGAALKEFNDRYGSRGMARGAVVLIISDGWETGDPALLGAQMARLHRVAYRIVWANPRTQSSRYRPEVGGMAAAWPYCDAVVSAHNLDALPDLLTALGST